MHFNREPRFYADLAFDGSIWYMENRTSNHESWTVKARYGQQQARVGAYIFSATGYWPKKYVNWRFEIQSDGRFTVKDYPWPEIRLSDLYLLYAEALNEAADNQGNRDKAIEYVDFVRARAGLEGVKESWDEHANNTKYNTQAGLRAIIQQERGIELMFEGHRYWDLRRWILGSKLNQTIHDWDIEQETPIAYYRPKELFKQSFVEPRDYLAPFREYTLIVNPNLVQNPGWYLNTNLKRNSI
ncbi:RagB/SusD family nutrient uptake outer membrane protein [termite gut metagenome]|uniref:RagB/SusD family nutrient uptake outer membrane protein n=1 Tax=termite gut metagenome TaxID=433724 RepID=A0A5J4RG47_9ZZZZ